MFGKLVHNIKQNKTEALIHTLLFWMFLWFLETGLGSSIDEKMKNAIRMNFLAIPLVFYFNSFYLIPHLLKEKKWILYILSVIGTLLFLEASRSVLHVTILRDSSDIYQESFLDLILGKYSISGGIFLGFLLSFAYRFTKDWLLNLTLIEKLKTERSEMKLAFLKSQVDPHFLFNTLNSLYGLALEEHSPKTADGIAKLGTLMRYNLHDSQAETIPLNKEIEYIQKYVDLQKLRITEKNTIYFELDIAESELHVNKISPMLLMPTIENAFKYGVSPSEKTEVSILIRVENKILTMKVENTIISNNSSKESSGVGIINLQERLQMLYPNKFTFDYSKNENIFKVHLELELI